MVLFCVTGVAAVRLFRVGRVMLMRSGLAFSG